jgi:hypothetical protein
MDDLPPLEHKRRKSRVLAIRDFLLRRSKLGHHRGEEDAASLTSSAVRRIEIAPLLVSGILNVRTLYVCSLSY